MQTAFSSKFLNTCIRLVFSSLMMLPVILLFYFITHFIQSRDCFSYYVTYKKNVSMPFITWPHYGLVTLLFDNDFFAANNKTIISLMRDYDSPGVIALTENKRCPLSLSKLISLQHDGWEIIPKKAWRFSNHQQNINAMPADDPKQYVFYDMTTPMSDVSFTYFLNETKRRNGWIILYFHTVDSKGVTRIDASKFQRILAQIHALNIPVVLPSQVLRVSL